MSIPTVMAGRSRSAVKGSSMGEYGATTAQGSAGGWPAPAQQPAGGWPAPQQAPPQPAGGWPAPPQQAPPQPAGGWPAPPQQAPQQPAGGWPAPPQEPAHGQWHVAAPGQPAPAGGRHFAEHQPTRPARHP